jgi:hypothetical protein
MLRVFIDDFLLLLSQMFSQRRNIKQLFILLQVLQVIMGLFESFLVVLRQIARIIDYFLLKKRAHNWVGFLKIFLGFIASRTHVPSCSFFDIVFALRFAQVWHIYVSLSQKIIFYEFFCQSSIISCQSTILSGQILEISPEAMNLLFVIG